MSRKDIVYYRRSRFATRLPLDRRYTPAHFWLAAEADGVWRVGFTQFATRMLGDIVECDFTIAPGSAIEVGQEIGSVEGFKAITALYASAAGEFVEPNPDLAADITLVEADPYRRGWLYRVRGEPDPASVDVTGYTAILDATIDRMLEERHASGANEDDENQG